MGNAGPTIEGRGAGAAGAVGRAAGMGAGAAWRAIGKDHAGRGCNAIVKCWKTTRKNI